MVCYGWIAAGPRLIIPIGDLIDADRLLDAITPVHAQICTLRLIDEFHPLASITNILVSDDAAR